jgi:hypothetical protein
MTLNDPATWSLSDVIADHIRRNPGFASRITLVHSHALQTDRQPAQAHPCQAVCKVSTPSAHKVDNSENGE